MAGDLAVGVEIAGHRIDSVIGRGGMGVVYLAEHLRLGRKVALKILDPQLAEDEAFRKRFVRESQLAAGLDHPNIVTVYDAGEVEGILYISMRYVEGTDLRQVLEEHSRLSPEVTLDIASQVGGALDAAHSEGLVHRDVKPGNVLLRPALEGEGFDRVYLSDFGVTKNLRGASTQTQTGQFIGTIDYMAPEQIKGGAVDRRVDVYSLGCVVYECLSGGPPYPREEAIGVMYAHLQDPPPLLNKSRAGLPSDLQPVIERSLAKRPQDRFATCAELVTALRTAIGSPESEAAHPRQPAAGASVTSRHSTEQLPRRAERRPRGRPLTAILVVLLVMGGGTFAAVQLLRGSGQSPHSRHGQRGVPTGSRSQRRPARSLFGPARITWKRWKRDETVFGGSGDQVVNRAIATRKVIIAVGYDSSSGDQEPAVWRYDGSSWSLEHPSVKPGDQGMAAVDAMGAGFVAVGADGLGAGQDGAVWTSREGQFWTRIEDPVFGGPGEQGMRRVVKGGPGLLAVGYYQAPQGDVDAAVWGSNDGRSWTRENYPGVFGGPGLQEMRSAVPFRSGIVAVGDEAVNGHLDAAVWRYDGTAWSRVATAALHAPGDQEMVTLARGPQGLVAVGDETSGGDTNAAVWKSADGIHWARVPSTAFGGPGVQEMRGITWTKAGFIAVGDDGPARAMDGAVWVSIDAQSWKEQMSSALGGPGIQLLRTAVVFHGKVFALGREHVPGNDDAACWVGSVHRL